MDGNAIIVVVGVLVMVVGAVALARQSKPSDGPRYGGAPYDPNIPTGPGDGSISPPSSGPNAE